MPSPGRTFPSLAAALLLGALFLATGCRPSSPAPTRGPPLRVGLDLWAGYYPLVIADARGFLAAENVAVDLRFPQDTHRMIAEFAARQHDLICVSAGDVILTTRVDPNLRLILQSDESTGGDAILARAPLTPAQLKGKRIGTALGGFGEFFVRQFLDHLGVAPGDVILVNADATTVTGLLASGEIDLGHTWEPYAAQARAAGYQELFSSRETPGLIFDGVIAHTSLIEKRPRELQGLVRAWFRAVEWWKTHEAEGNALVEQRLKLAPGSVSLKGIRLLDQADNRRSFGPDVNGGPLGSALRRQVDFFINRGVLGRRVTPAELLDPRFIP